MSDETPSLKAKADVLAEIRVGALAALRRAQRRAEETAVRTGTALIRFVNGKPVRVPPPKEAAGS